MTEASVLVKWFLGFCELIRTSFTVPFLRISLHICLFMSFLLSVQWVIMMSYAIMGKLWRKPEKRYKWKPIEYDLATGNANFPLVLVQIPIFNEKEVYKIAINAACNLSWPANRLVIQVLDDSTDLVVKDMIAKECEKWRDEGINIRHQYRETRAGYKAGALKCGLECDYVQECEYVAIFDADFQPEQDFLLEAIPFLVHNKELALVQARWTFVNADECFLTRMQEISLDYSFIIEEGGSSLNSFFIFNGSGGIWRIAAINDAGGWKDRTTVEDLDLSVRAALNGWKFVYLGNLHVKSELPSTFKAYRSQQHRWCCGTGNLLRKMIMEIAKNKEVSLWMKVYVTYDFFFAWRIVANVFAFLFYCVVLPLATVVPEIDVQKSRTIFFTFIAATINTAFSTPRSTSHLFTGSLHLALPWILFENIICFHRTKALIIGLLHGKSSSEWIVTEKVGDSLKNKPNSRSTISKCPSQLTILKDRLLLQEVGLAVFLLGCGWYGLVRYKDPYSIYLFLQSLFFAIAGFGFFGKIVLPSSEHQLAAEPSEYTRLNS